MSDVPKAQDAVAAPPPPGPPIPHIGAFVLETLTLGMYGEPRHTLREYVQNAFDSIELSRRNGWLAGRGRVEVSLSADEIAIRDNGTGIPAAQAWSTLTSIGASKKDRRRDAGFRGIGRLAGMAYCDHLVFRTRFGGEDVVTEVDFDCGRLLKAMSPDDGGDVELATLLRESISTTSAAPHADEPSNFFEVAMRGLSGTPSKLTDPSSVRAYLSETSPVGYAPDWTYAASVETNYKEFFGSPLQTIDLFVTAENERSQIFKPYGDTYEHAKGTTALEVVEFTSGPDGSYWGWIGHLSDVVAVTDDRSRGLRARVRNIQVDGTELFHELFTAVSASYGRLSNYYVGEVHVAPDRIVPNARRDGFEETREWIRIKRDLSDRVCGPLARQVYKASSDQQVDVGKIIEEVGKLELRASTLAGDARATYDQVVDVMSTAKRLRKRAVAALKTLGDVQAAAEEEADTMTRPPLREAVQTVEGVESVTTALLGRVLSGDNGRLEGLRSRLREELVREMLDVVRSFVDPPTFQRIRRQLANDGQATSRTERATGA